MTTATKHITESPNYEPRTDSIYVALPGERYTPFSLGKKLGAKAIFESASFSHGRSRYSRRAKRSTTATALPSTGATALALFLPRMLT